MTEKELIAKITKLIDKSEKLTAEKYRGIFFFMKDLESKNINCFELLKNKWNEENNRK